MDRTSKVIDNYYDLLEYSISAEDQEFFGVTITLSDLQSLHDVVALDANCSDFKDSDKIQPGEVVYIEDPEGDLSPVQVRN